MEPDPFRPHGNLANTSPVLTAELSNQFISVMTQVQFAGSTHRPASLTLDLDTVASIASSRWFQTPEIMMILTRLHDIGLTVSECLPQVLIFLSTCSLHSDIRKLTR
jgi:uncharacterized membrane protein YhaH (DUF805 family)